MRVRIEAIIVRVHFGQGGSFRMVIEAISRGWEANMANISRGRIGDFAFLGDFYVFRVKG